LVTTLANGCSALKHVNLSYCSLVSDSGRTRIQSCCQLEAVNVSHCSGVNGSGLGGFLPTSTRIDADSFKLEAEGIIGIVSGGGGGVEYLNVSCMKWCVSGDAVQQ
jgi:F-box/leucine-rich repeat protein 2/20